MFQKKYFEYTEMGGGGAQEAVRGGKAFLAPPPPHRHDGTANTPCKKELKENRFVFKSVKSIPWDSSMVVGDFLSVNSQPF